MKKALMQNAIDIWNTKDNEDMQHRYDDMNPLEALYTKAKDIGFQQMDNTPSLATLPRM